MKKNNKLLLFTGFLIFLASNVMIFGDESLKSFDFSDTKKWQIEFKKTELIKYKDKNALRIIPAAGTGIVYLKDFNFQNGIIELDIAAIPRFTGIIFRIQDKNTYEGIYFRPQNSRHQDTDKRPKTVQYISEPKHPWHLLRKTHPGKYENAVDLPPEEWFHVKLVISDLTVKVYVNNSPKPCLVVNDLKLGKVKGPVGVWTGNTSGGTFSNLRINKQ